jgi:hypothetical protein
MNMTLKTLQSRLRYTKFSTFKKIFILGDCFPKENVVRRNDSINPTTKLE